MIQIARQWQFDKWQQKNTFDKSIVYAARDSHYLSLDSGILENIVDLFHKEGDRIYESS